MSLKLMARVDYPKVRARARKKYGSTAALARAIGCHPGSIWNLRSGSKLPSKEFADQIADALGVPLAAILLPDEDEEAPEPEPAPRARSGRAA